MRILHVVNDANTGGAQTLIEQLAQELSGSVDSHILVLLGKGSLSKRLEGCAASVTYLDLDKTSIRVDLLVRKTRQVIQALSPDVVHSHLLQADLAVSLGCVGLQVGTVSTVHTTGMTAQDPLRSRLLGKLLGAVTNQLIDQSVACSSSAVEYMRGNGYDLRRVAVINNGVALAKGPSPKGPAAKGVIVSLSRWHPMKDHANLFRAFKSAYAEDPSLRLLCAGSGMEVQNNVLTEMLEKLQIIDAVTLLGSVQDVRGLLRRADALVLSSSYGEALPMAGLEALAEGVPVITTDVGDCSHLTLGTWQCVPPRSSELLADAIRTLYSLTESEFLDLSRKSSELVLRKYSIASTASQYLDVYKKVTRTLKNSNDVA